MSEVESPSPKTDSPPQEVGSTIGPIVVGAAMVLIGLVLLWQTFKIEGEGFDPQGPRFFPLLVVSFWIVLSALYLGHHLMDLARAKQGMASERYEHTVPVVLLVVLSSLALIKFGYLDRRIHYQ